MLEESCLKKHTGESINSYDLDHMHPATVQDQEKREKLIQVCVRPDIVCEWEPQAVFLCQWQQSSCFRVFGCIRYDSSIKKTNCWYTTVFDL